MVRLQLRRRHEARRGEEEPSPAARAEAPPPCESAHWAKWREILTAEGAAPRDYTQFDRTVRGMLNRISQENACRLLPLEPSLRGGQHDESGGDCPSWWAARFAALMLSSYLQVIHTSRHARGLAVRSSDNALPGYLDAMAPLLVKSPRVVSALMAWLAKLLNWQDFCWPKTRLLLLAARESRGRETLPGCSLGRLPGDLIRGRILAYLVPPRAPAVEVLLEVCPSRLQQWPMGESEEKDVVAMLAHLIMFSPLPLWPRFSAFGFAFVEAILTNHTCCQEREVYLAASVLATIAQRLEAGIGAIGGCEEHRRRCLQDLVPMRRLAATLHEVVEAQRQPAAEWSPFVSCRVQAALERTRRVQLQQGPAALAMEQVAA